MAYAQVMTVLPPCLSAEPSSETALRPAGTGEAEVQPEDTAHLRRARP